MIISVPAPRKLRCYVEGRNKIRDWYDGLSPTVRADTDEFVKDMLRKQKWGSPDFEPMRRKLRGFWELRWKSDKKHHRLIGYFVEPEPEPGKDLVQVRDFGIVIACTHKENYDPPDCLKTASDRKKKIESGQARFVDYDI